MSPLAIVIVVVAVLAILFFIGGLVAVRRRAREHAGVLDAKIRAADQALEAARAADRGWDPILLEEAARLALERERPDFRYDRLHLVLVDDRPGTEADRAEMAAVGSDGVVHVRVARRGDNWVAEDVS
jgi:type II secretory pathway pseudopilin PulG